MKFHETFLKPGLFVTMRADHAFPLSSGSFPSPYGVEQARYTSSVHMPAVCAGCVTPTRSFTPKQFVCLFKYLSGASTTSVTIKPQFQIPICDSCAGYGLLDHVRIYTNVVGNIPRTLYVSFAFPNIGFYKHFAEENRLDRESWLSGNTVFPKQTPQNIVLLEKLLKEWQTVETFGFHKYLAIKEKLLALNQRYSWFNRRKNRPQIEAELQALMTSHGLSVAELKDLQTFMNRKLRIPGI